MPRSSLSASGSHLAGALLTGTWCLTGTRNLGDWTRRRLPLPVPSFRQLSKILPQKEQDAPSTPKMLPSPGR